MTVKTSTFAGQLKHFAQSVDIVDDSTFDQVRDLICKYVMNELGGEYFELLRHESAGDGDRQSWLRTFWSSEEKVHSWPVQAADGSYVNPVTDAFARDCPMWLVSPDKRPIDEAESPQDLWSHTATPGRYRPSSVEPIRTVVLVPLSFPNLAGIYCIESSQYIEATDVAKLELRRLADALALLYRSWEVNKAHLVCKHHAISDLRDLLRLARFPKLAKPHFFVAYSNRADETVKLAIKDTLRQFSSQLEFTDWAQMTEAGNISTQIGKEILESRFGICYLSEPVDSESFPPAAAQVTLRGLTCQYDDNKNVVFEAGMLHAHTMASAETDEGEPTGWIPIREQSSPPPPFDFAAERILYIPRSGSGELNESRFKEMLAQRIVRLLSES